MDHLFSAKGHVSSQAGRKITEFLQEALPEHGHPGAPSVCTVCSAVGFVVSLLQARDGYDVDTERFRNN